MSVPVPLGVRFYSMVRAGERWVTKFVDDIQYRSVVPGGFASATITLRVPRNMAALASPDPLGFSQLTELFARVQVVDLETMEIAWEGRIEDPARQVEPDTWQIGALGSMVAATDVQRPVFYIDSSLDRWATGDLIDSSGGIIFQANPGLSWSTSKDDAQRSLTIAFKSGYTLFDGNDDFTWRWDSHGYDQPIARYSLTQKGYASNGTQAALTDVIVGIAANPEVQVTLFTAAETTKTNVIGTQFTDANTRWLAFGADRHAGAASYTIGSTETVTIRVRDPKIVGIRCNRFGTRLTTAASYPGTYVTVAQVVEDVVGRFLAGGWFENTLNTPLPGSVRSQDVYIDATDTTQILHLAYPEGATAADILNDLISQVQTNAYWAIWESNWKASDADHDFTVNSGFRFEWATWPDNWGYLASSQDGLEGQPNGDDVWNFVSYRYPDNGDSNQYHVTTAWLGSDQMSPELYAGGFTRAITVNKTDPTDGSTAGALRDAYLNSKRKVLNAGTLTVRRPIQFFDTGTNSASGAARTVDPWMIRPGKLVRIADLPPRAMERDASSGSALPSSTIDGTIFRVVATDYSSSDNTCRLSLDQVTRWQVPTQISQTGGGTKTIRIQ